MFSSTNYTITVSNSTGSTTATVVLSVTAHVMGYRVTTFAGNSNYPSFADGLGTYAHFSSPIGVAVDSNGNVYVADSNNQRIRKITSGGQVTTLGGGQSSGSVNGPGAVATFWSPYGVAVDASGNVYVADTYNDLIREIESGDIVRTLAGTIVGGSADGNGTSASFLSPRGLAVDSSGNAYVADTNNHLIRKITPGGVVSTLAGCGIGGLPMVPERVRVSFIRAE